MACQGNSGHNGDYGFMVAIYVATVAISTFWTTICLKIICEYVIKLKLIFTISVKFTLSLYKETELIIAQISRVINCTRLCANNRVIIFHWNIIVTEKVTIFHSNIIVTASNNISFAIKSCSVQTWFSDIYLSYDNIRCKHDSCSKKHFLLTSQPGFL